MSVTKVCLVLVAMATAIAAIPSSRVHQMSVDKQPKFDGYKLSYAPYHKTFLDFQNQFGIYYDTPSEEWYRLSIFVDNLKYIEAHNALYHQGNKSFYLAINQFADKTLEEYRQYNRLGHHSKSLKLRQERTRDDSPCEPYTASGSVPESLDWRQEGAVTNVKNQGQCGSCWTFSTTGSVEGSFAILTKHLISFSEQQIVDCCHLKMCSGCEGGIMDMAFEYINQTGGLETEREYGYTAEDDRCEFVRSDAKVHVTGCYDLPQGDETTMMNAVGQKGPVSVAIDANHQSFMYYGGGIYSNEDCSPNQLDHGVLAVGYGSHDGNDYWMVKNSWGTEWGLSGYVMMSRNNNNNCGIASEASFPITARP